MPRECAINDSLYSLFVSVKNPLIFYDSSYWNNIYFENKIYNTRQISAIAKERGYDGVIFNHLEDIGGAGNLLQEPDEFYESKANLVKQIIIVYIVLNILQTNLS